MIPGGDGESGQRAANTQLSFDATYADVRPVRDLSLAQAQDPLGRPLWPWPPL
jgi:hypothetical protein